MDKRARNKLALRRAVSTGQCLQEEFGGTIKELFISGRTYKEITLDRELSPFLNSFKITNISTSIGAVRYCLVGNSIKEAGLIYNGLLTNEELRKISREHLKSHVDTMKRTGKGIYSLIKTERLAYGRKGGLKTAANKDNFVWDSSVIYFIFCLAQDSNYKINNKRRDLKRILEEVQRYFSPNKKISKSSLNYAFSSYKTGRKNLSLEDYDF